MAQQQPIIGITTNNIVDNNYGIPINYHKIERIEITKNYVTISLAGYFNADTAASGKQPLAHNAISFVDFVISDSMTMRELRDALYQRAINPTETDADMFSGGELVRAE